MNDSSHGEQLLERQSGSLARRPEKAPLEDDVALQKLWLAVQKRPWRSLAVVAGDDDISTLEVATRLAEIAWWYRGQPTSVLDLRNLGLRLVDYQLQEIDAQIEQGDCIIIALKSIFSNPTTVAIASAVDAAIICVQLGRTRMNLAEKTVDEIGREKFIGSIVVEARKGERSSRHERDR